MDELLKDAAPAAPATPTAESDNEAIDKIAERNADETQATDSQIAEPEPLTLGGTAVSPGAAFGHAQMFAEGELEIPHFTIEKRKLAPNSLACALPCTRLTKSSAN